MSDQEPTVRTLHDSAIEATHEAHASYRRAYSLERQAFEIVAALPAEGREPTFSILCSSAAWLAFNANFHRDAIELAERGLVEGKPDGYIRHVLGIVIEWSRRMIKEKDGNDDSL